QTGNSTARLVKTETANASTEAAVSPKSYGSGRGGHNWRILSTLGPGRWCQKGSHSLSLKESLIHLRILKKEKPKVVNEINIEVLCLTKAVYDRCWYSMTTCSCNMFVRT
uniref:Uncharacterized protein n=1 Tax=Marmota marmota marmota TaxID=9994 RepID=A0A8C5Z476_MARMA